MLHVAHLTSVHPRFDTRIFLKMCVSLADNGYDVSLIVADGQGPERRNGVKVYDVGAPKGRLYRIIKSTNKVYHEAIKVNADLYHIHDPELITTGLKLKRLGRKVIFDSHEDVPKQLLSKPYLNTMILRILSFVYAHFERVACSRFDVILSATPHIRDKFFKINSNSVNINNFPILEELMPLDIIQKREVVSYVGGISAVRGIREIVQAMDYVRPDIKLNLAGKFADRSLAEEVRLLSGWNRVNELGFVDRGEVRELLACSLAGLVTFRPAHNHYDALPNKMFEYMSAGVPVIASDFPLWREIIEGNECGMCVDPMDPRAIAKAIDHIAANPELAREMGRNGQRAVRNLYNWGVEEKKLLAVYEAELRVI